VRIRFGCGLDSRIYGILEYSYYARTLNKRVCYNNYVKPTNQLCGKVQSFVMSKQMILMNYNCSSKPPRLKCSTAKVLNFIFVYILLWCWQPAVFMISGIITQTSAHSDRRNIYCNPVFSHYRWDKSVIKIPLYWFVQSRTHRKNCQVFRTRL